MPQPRGVDAQGRIAQLPDAPVPAPFDCLLKTAGDTLQQALEPSIHSLYVYGSVARGTARVGQSDLDLCLLLHTPATPAQQAQIDALRADLQTRCAGIVTKVDIDLGDAATALAVNEGYDAALRSLATRIRRAGGDAALQKQAARQWIRATHILCAGDEPGWPQTLQDYADHCRRSHPALAAGLSFMLAQADTPDAPAESFARTLEGLLDTMQTLQAQQRRNAGARSP